MPEIRQVFVLPLASGAQPQGAVALKSMVLRHRIRRIVTTSPWTPPPSLSLDHRCAASTRPADLVDQLGPGANLLIVAADLADEVIRQFSENGIPWIILPTCTPS